MPERDDELSALPAAWRGDSLFERADWQVDLGPADLEELRQAAAATANRPIESVAVEDVELPRLSARLAGIQRSLETGSGATRVTGLFLDGVSDETAARMFWCLAVHVGTPVSQTAKGERLLHVRDEGFGANDPRVRGPHTSRRLSFHTDRCDVIAFLCVRPARSGGENHVISSVTLHNEMLRRHPEQLRVLQEPFVYLRHTVDPGNSNPFIQQPIFAMHDGHFAASFLRVLIDRADREPGVPDLTAAQREALDTLEAVAEDPELYARFRLRAGDVLLLNNWVTFHRRTEFEDFDEPERKRHLMRLWLSVPNSRPLDPRFAAHFGQTGAGEVRGGIHPA